MWIWGTWNLPRKKLPKSYLPLDVTRTFRNFKVRLSCNVIWNLECTFLIQFESKHNAACWIVVSLNKARVSPFSERKSSKSPVDKSKNTKALPMQNSQPYSDHRQPATIRHSSPKQKTTLKHNSSATRGRAAKKGTLNRDKSLEGKSIVPCHFASTLIYNLVINTDSLFTSITIL